MKESMEIFMRHGLENEYLEAGHDEIFGPRLDLIEDMPPEDLARLEELGWYKNDEIEYLSAFV
jgi:hypothetical protein